MHDYIFLNDKSLADFGVYITDAGVYAPGKRNYEMVSIPGRNGDIIFENDRWDNVDLVYPAFIIKDFDANYTALMSFLYSQKGYVKVSDTFHPDEFYLATFSELRDLKHTIGRKIGSFKIVFNRKPQRYLRSGDRVSSFSDAGVLKNPTTFDALPLIRAYGTGSFTIGDISVAITSADTYTDIDCELQEAYKGSVNCNGNITLTDGVFPHFAPGVNNISMTGITSLEITPRWWRI